MALREEMEHSGARLFRWRSYLPLVLLLCVLLHQAGFGRVQSTLMRCGTWDALCLVVSLTGLAIRAFTIAQRPHGTSGRNTRTQVADTLNTTGAYSVVRHPLYLGNFFMWMGVALFTQSWWLVTICALSFWLYYERIMLAEEQFLRATFGESFLRWAAATPAFVPRLTRWQPSLQPFVWGTVVRCEKSGFLALMCIFTLLDLVRDSAAERRVAADAAWLGAVVSSLILYLLLRARTRRTRSA